MKSHLLLAACAAAAFASPVSAAPNGPRVEAIVGVDRAQLDSFGNRDDPGETGVVYGLGAGYDFAVGRTVAVGVDLEASDSSAAFHYVSPPDDNSLRLGLDLYAGARLTVAAFDRLNLYVKAGYTSLQTHLVLLNPVFALDADTSRGGARLGTGVQVAVGGNFYIGGEYRFSTYDELDRHQGVATLGVRF
jgi:outer membrane immunogenic protein